MADPVLWGPLVWRANFALAAKVDRLVAQQHPDALEAARNMQRLLTVESFVYPCDDCSYFAIEYVVACPVPRTLFVDYLYDMKACIDAKIKTVQYDKHKVEECIPPHLSRMSFYRRMRLAGEDDAKQDWAILVALGARHAEQHEDKEIRLEALNSFVALLSNMIGTGAPPKPIDSLDAAMGALQAWGVDLEKTRHFVRVAFE
jgi:hypothetical protein